MTHGTRPLPPGELEGEESQCHHRANEHAFLSGWTVLQHGYIDLKSSALWPAVVFSTVRRKWDNQHLSNSGELHISAVLLQRRLDYAENVRTSQQHGRAERDPNLSFLN